MKILNLTPHKVVVGQEKIGFEPCGITARIHSDTEHVGTISTCDGEATLEVCRAIYGEVELYKALGANQDELIPNNELPEADYYIVSSIVADRWEQMRGRMLVPYYFIRDGEGNIAGCKQFRLV